MFELEGIDEENLTKDIKKRLLSIVDATVDNNLFFRPFVDLEVYNMFELEEIDEENLTKDIKKRLLSIVDATVLINNEKFTMLNAIDKYTDSLFNSFKKQNIDELIEVSIWI
jgi:hypothetical protein